MSNNIDVKVSVIIPIYNAFDYLQPALDSVIAQTLKEIEIICIDDGSIDKSFELLKEYQKKDDRIRIVTEANAGPALARNNGIKRARGEYLAFLDADDFYEKDFLEELYCAATAENLDIAIGEYDIYNTHKARFESPVLPDHSEIFDGYNVTSKNEHPDKILSSTTGSAWNKLFRRSFVESKQLSFPEDVRMYEDVYFTVTALSFAERVGRVPKVLMHHRVHNEQARVKNFSKYYSQIPAVYGRIKDFLVNRGMYAPLLRSYLNLSASRCYKVFNLLSKDSKENFWNLLHDEYSECLGWQERNAVDFENDDVYKFVLYTQLYSYKEYKKRLCADGSLKVGNVDVEIAKKRKRIRKFFAKIFKRKKK